MRTTAAFRGAWRRPLVAGACLLLVATFLAAGGAELAPGPQANQSAEAPSGPGARAAGQQEQAGTGPSSALVREDELLASDEADDAPLPGSSSAAAKKEPQPTKSGATAPQLDLEGLLARTGTNSGQQQQQQQQQLVRTAAEQASGALPALLSSASSAAESQGLSVSGLVRVSPDGLSKSVGALAARLPETMATALQQQQAALGARNEPETDDDISGLLPKATSLFNRDSINPSELADIDCHLRNVDYCVAGLMGSSQRLLPEADRDLETRCDEIKASTSCIAIYNKRCHTLKIFSMLAPFIQASADDNSPSAKLADEQRKQFAALSQEIKLGPQLESSLLNRQQAGNESSAVSMGNLMELCEPGAKGEARNRELRQRLFSMAKCINQRVPQISNCMTDLKTAIQLFYEPRRSLPLQPTCCAISRFRACSSDSMDGACGLGSFDGLLKSLTEGSGAGPMSMLGGLGRVCRQANDHRSTYCAEVLPPSGVRVPQRRGQKASKLARVLDLFSFSPAAQDPTAALA